MSQLTALLLSGNNLTGMSTFPWFLRQWFSFVTSFGGIATNFFLFGGFVIPYTDPQSPLFLENLSNFDSNYSIPCKIYDAARFACSAHVAETYICARFNVADWLVGYTRSVQRSGTVAFKTAIPAYVGGDGILLTC